MDPQLIQSIAQAVMLQLQKQTNNNASLISQVAQQVVLQPLKQRSDAVQIGITDDCSGLHTPSAQSCVSRSSSGLSTTTTTSDASISRSSSGLSAASTASISRSSSGLSATSTPSDQSNSARRTLNFAEIETKMAKKRRRRRLDPEANAVIDAITRPIMEALDDKYLAPIESELFKRQLKKTRKPNGQRPLRKFKTMVMPLFRKLIRPIIRQLLGRLDTPNASQIYTKYYRTAIKIVTKRRANHVQNWRLYGEPAKLCYSSVPIQRQQQELKRQKREVQFQENEDLNLQKEHADQQHESQYQVGRDLSESEEEHHDSQFQGDLSNEESANDEEMVAGSADVIDESKFCCVDCKRSFPGNESYPRDNNNVWRNNVSSRCKECWTAHMIDNVSPILHNDKEKTTLSDSLTGKKRKSLANKRTTRKQTIGKCKWCGDSSHKTKRSKKCPFFGKSTDTSPSVAPPDVTTAPVDDSSDVIPPPVDDLSVVTSPPVAASAPVAASPPAVVPPVPFRQRFNIGDNVLAMWSRRKWFLAHVTRFSGGLYDLYFPDDGKIKERVPLERVKPIPVTTNGIPVHTRGEMINKVFYDDGDDGTSMSPGMWLVRCIKGNEYVCVRSPDCRNKNDTPNCVNFDIGHVIRVVTESEQQNRNTF